MTNTLSRPFWQTMGERMARDPAFAKEIWLELRRLHMIEEAADQAWRAWSSKGDMPAAMDALLASLGPLPAKA